MTNFLQSLLQFLFSGAAGSAPISNVTLVDRLSRSVNALRPNMQNVAYFIVALYDYVSQPLWLAVRYIAYPNCSKASEDGSGTTQAFATPNT